MAEHRQRPTPEGPVYSCGALWEMWKARYEHEQAGARPVGSPQLAHELCLKALKDHANWQIPIQTVYEMLLIMIGRQDILDAIQNDWETINAGEPVALRERPAAPPPQEPKPQGEETGP